MGRTVRYCGHCKRTNLTLKEDGTYRPHKDDRGKPCDGAGSKALEHTYPDAEPPLCAVCTEVIPYGEECYAIYPCLQVRSFGDGRNTYLKDAGAKPLGGIHKGCIVPDPREKKTRQTKGGT